MVLKAIRTYWLRCMEGNIVVAMNELLIRIVFCNFYQLVLFVAATTIIVPAALPVAAASATTGSLIRTPLPTLGTWASTLPA